MTNDVRTLFDSHPWQHRFELGDSAPWGFLGKREGHLLYHLARDFCTGAGVVVDAGAFLGCSAWYFARGLAQNPQFGAPRPTIHSFDNFIVNDALTTEAIEGHFGEHLTEGMSTRHLFDRQTREVAPWLVVHEGDFHTYAWPPQPIEVLLVDVAKSTSLNRRVIEVFFPQLIPGRSIVVQQDYHHPWLPHIHVAMEYLGDYFELVEPKADDSAAFRLVRAIPAATLAAAARAHELPFNERLALMDAALQRLPPNARRSVELARANLLAHGSGYEAMREAMASIDARYPADDPDEPLWGRYRREMHDLLVELEAPPARGWRRLWAGDVEGALSIVEAVPAGHPARADALVLRTHCLRRLARYEEAERVIDEALALRQEHAHTWVERAWVSVMLNRHEAAIEAAGRGLTCATEQLHAAAAHDVRATALSMLGRHDESVAAGRGAIDMAPSALWIQAHHAQNLLRARRHQEARDQAQRILAVEPANAAARAVLQQLEESPT